MGYAADMCDIVVENAGDRVRYFVRIDPDTRDRDVLHVRDDIDWGETQEKTVENELHELVAKETYAEQMDAEEVTQLIKVADDAVLFTGFIEDEVVVVMFDRGIFGALPTVVAEFREYMLANDIDFTSLTMDDEAS